MMRDTLLTTAILVLAVACGTVPDRNAIPPELGLAAEIPGIPNARYWGDETPEAMQGVMLLPPEEMERQFSALFGRDHHFLAISGGGSNGAFGAGLLSGWTASGTRPEFGIVTGISTGALIAPFAFLGPEYDPLLKQFFTTITTADIITKRSLLRGVTSDALADSEPLRRLIAEYVDEAILSKVAAAHRQGRRLLIGTVNLDAARPVVWNMGVIAASDAPHRLELFRSVLLASASIPGGFPPVFIPVVADGGTYDEIHVDGGTCTQVFLLPVGVDWKEIKQRLQVKSRPRIWVIRNARLDPKWVSLDPTFSTLAGRTISSLIRTQGIGDLIRIWVDARENDMDFNLAYVPKTFTLESKEPFDKAYMNELYDLAYRLAKDGYPWSKTPPGEESIRE